MTELPKIPNVKVERELTPLVQPKPDSGILHNWLYSVVPARMAGSVWSMGSAEPISEISIYLAGYCRNCGKAFSSPISFGTGYTEIEMGIPKTGCVDPYAGF